MGEECGGARRSTRKIVIWPSAKMLVIIEKSALILGSLLNRNIISIIYTNYRFKFKRGFLDGNSFHLFPHTQFPLHPILSQIHSNS